MSQDILVIVPDHPVAERIAEALATLDQPVVTVSDLDGAVNACAKAEPRVVVIAAKLGRLTAEEAIMQLRARAGLKTTPFLVLEPGYQGEDSRADAHRIGAQDVVDPDADADHIKERVVALFEPGRAQTVTGPEGRAGAFGASGAASTMTSEEIFGDLLAEEDESAKRPPQPASVAETQRIPVAPAVPPAKPPDATAGSDAVSSSLADMLSSSKPSAPGKPRQTSSDSSVDDLLSKTLSGLEPSHRRPTPKPAEAPPPEPAAAAEVEETVKVPVPQPPPAAAPPREEPIVPGPGKTVSFGQYELIEQVATGGMAELFKARMKGVEGFQKIVAIKRILPHLTSNEEFVTMFVDEAKLAAQLQHPNIIHIYDLGKIERSYYIAMEYIDGKDLRSILHTLAEHGRRMPMSLALFIGTKLAAALDYAHRKKDLQGHEMALVHRDVSPQNVLISFDGDIKLCDFGIAKAASKASHTRAGALKGKLQYMSPEQAWGKDLDGRSDIFSLGLVLYEMLTGRKAFAGDSELSILEQVRAPRLVSPHEIDENIPAEVEAILMKSLREDRDTRYQTAGELSEALDGLIQKLGLKPSSGELGRFLAEVAGRAKPAEPEAVPVEAKAPAARKPAPAPPAPSVPIPEITATDVVRPARQGLNPLVLIGIAAAVVIGIVAVWLMSSSGSKETTAAATPTPDVSQMVSQELDKRLQPPAGEGEQPAGQVPAVAAGRPNAPATQPTVTAVAVPTPAPTTPPAPAAVAVQPTALPTVAPTAVPTAASELPTPVPTEPVPTPIPTAVPTRAPAAPTQPPAPVVHEGDLVEAGAGVIAPEPLSMAPPEYPPAAARQRLGGVVIVDALVDETGAVTSVQILRGVRADIDQSARDAVLKWRFRPATKNGVRVKMHYRTSIPFRP